jgi:hypothetical protein
MYKVGGLCRPAGRCGGRLQILALLAILGATYTVAGAQIDVNEAGLHDGASVYGLDAPPAPIPYVNLLDITLFAWGETNPDLYPNASFSAYGLHGETSVDNGGGMDVVATGGNAHAGGSTIASAGVWAYGMYTLGGVTNTGDLRITAVSGAADANTHAEAHSIIQAIYAGGDVNNTGDITITATGGNAHTNAGNANALGGADGVYASHGLITNTGRIDIVATGGTALAESTSSGSQAIARAGATGLFFWDAALDNAGELRVTAQGGSATGSDYADATADTDGIGASHGDADNRSDIMAIALGGRADGANSARTDATAAAIMVHGGYAHNTGDLTALAVGGTATTDGSGAAALASADSYGAGINTSGIATNSGNISVTARGGSADANSGVSLDSIARASARGYGISADSGVSNSGTITGIVTGGTVTSDAGIADANAYAYGIEVFNGNADNHGTMTIVATGGTADGNDADAIADAQGSAYGVYITNGLITNGGPIVVAASGGTALSGAPGLTENASASGQAYGLYAESGAIENTGRITVTAQGGHALAVGDVNAATTAYGIFSASGGATNSGDMTVTAVSGTADTGSRALGLAIARGIYLLDGDLDNTGNLAVAATSGTTRTDGSDSIANINNDAFAEGVYVLGMLNNSGNVNVTATGRVAADTGPVHEYYGPIANAIARGLIALDGINNSGDVVAVATGGTATSRNNAQADAHATGLRTFGALNNSGAVTVIATGGTAAGAYASAGVDTGALSGYSVNNTGTLTVVATGGTATASEGARVFSWAEGIAGAPVVNTGAVSVTATAGTASGNTVQGEAYAVGISTADYVYNSGDITVAATAHDGSASKAYGIRANGYTNITNTGVIRAAADTAYELYVAAYTSTLVDTYNVTLDGDPNRASLGVADGATLVLNNATLTVAAVSGETLWDTEYKLFETEGTGAVDGNFAEARAVNPNTTALYHDQGTAASVDDTVSLAFTPVGATPLASAAVQKQLITQAADAVNHHMTTMLLQNLLSPSASGLLASAGSTAESIALAEAAAGKPAGIFVEPYYSLLDHDANPLGYDARLWGFSAGYERYFENTILGLHLGYGRSDIDYTGAGFSGNSEDQDVVTGGFCGLTRWEPWILDYGVTAFYGSQDYEGRTGLALDERETASYHSYGTATTLMAGHLLRWGPHVFLPEVGLDWLWVHRPQYTTEATDPSFDTTYSTRDDHDVYAAAALQWMSSFLHDDIRVTPSVALGVRYLLTDDETGTVVSVPGAAPVLVESEQNRTVLTLSGALTLTRTPHALSLAYDGDYSPDLQRHSVWLRYTRLF